MRIVRLVAELARQSPPVAAGGTHGLPPVGFQTRYEPSGSLSCLHGSLFGGGRYNFG